MMKNNKFKKIILVLLIFLCAFFVNNENEKTYGIYREELNTSVYLSILNPALNVTVNFVDTEGGNSVNSIPVAINTASGPLPTITRTGYNFLGWYKYDGTKADPNENLLEDVTYYAHWQQIVCKKVTSDNNLHTEKCSTNGGCRLGAVNIPINSDITYGTEYGLNSPKAGDAYDCDVNYDGVFDAQTQYGKYTERFYLLREIEHENSENTAALVYYTSFDTTHGAVDSQHDTNIGSTTYGNVKSWLPTSTNPSSDPWDNPNLITHASNNGNISRLLTIQDIEAVCGSPFQISQVSYFVSCGKWFFFENSRFQAKALGRAGIWLEMNDNKYYRIHTESVNIAIPDNGASSENMARPVIEIPVSAMEGYVPKERFKIEFDTHGGTPQLGSIRKYDGETIGTIDPVTKEFHDFDGWYATYSNDTYSDPVTTSTVVHGNMTLHAKWTKRPTNTVTFNANGDGATVEGESTIELEIETGDTFDTLPTPIWGARVFGGWYKDNNTFQIPFTTNDVVNSNFAVFAKWTVTDYAAEVNGVGYPSLAEAIAAVPTGTSVKTTVTILKNLSLESGIIIPNNKWVELDGGIYTVNNSNSSVATLITNNGKLDIVGGTFTTTVTNVVSGSSGSTLNISGGTLSNTNPNSVGNVIEMGNSMLNMTGGKVLCAAQGAAINNRTGSSGVLNVSGGEIRGSNTIKGQAIYIEKGASVNISGDSYIENVSLSSGSSARAAIDNNGGKLVITGGTIVSQQHNAVDNRAASASTRIGTDDANIYITTPVIRGKMYGLSRTNGTVDIYDGLFESLENTRAISGTIHAQPDDINFIDSTIDVAGVTYHSTYLFVPSLTVRFFPENGESSASITVDNGTTIGAQMPSDPTKANYYFDGWYDGNTLITSTTLVTTGIDAYARWVQSISNATISSSMSVEMNSSATIAISGSDLESVTYSTSDASVATVDANGVVTGVGVGSATITITGAKSSDTRTVTVTVTPLMHTVRFLASDGETVVYTREIVHGSSLDAAMPANPTDTNYVFDKWTISGELTPFNSVTVVTGNVDVVENWKEKVTYAALSTSPSPFELVVGNTGQITLNATVQGDTVEEYTLTSNNSSVASIGPNNVITALGVGTTDIIVTGNLSSATVNVSVTVDVLKYTVTFKDGDNVIKTVKVESGSSVGVDMPSNQTKTNYIFDGWVYENNNSLTPFTSATEVYGDIDVVVSWIPSIQLATIPATFNVVLGRTETISVSGPSGMEGYTFSSASDAIATVNSSTGAVTGQALGTVNITVTGTISNTTRTVEVTVINLTHTVSFLDSDGLTELDTSRSVNDGSTLGGDMPSNPTKTNYIFAGWLMEVNNELLPFTSATEVYDDIDVIASWKETLSIATIPESPFKIMVEDSETILVTATGGGLVEDYTLSSNNTNLVEIDGKEIFGVDVGSVTLTITGVESSQTRTITVNVVNTYDVTFDPDNGDEPIVISVERGTEIGNLMVTTDPVKAGSVFDRWYLYENDELTTTPIDETRVINKEETYKAKWVSTSYYAAIGTEYFTTLKGAIDSITTSDVTEIRILQNITSTSGKTTIDANENIVLNGGNHTVDCGNGATGQLMYISTNASVRVKSGTFTCGKNGLAVFETQAGGTLYVDGGLIYNTNNRGAVYNSGTVVISGGELKTDATIRPVVQNAASGASILMTGGTIIQTTDHLTSTDGRGAIKVINGSTAIIKGGTITANADDSAAIFAAGGTLVIGTQDNTYDATTPVIQNANYYGIESSVNYSIYDGIIKGNSSGSAVNNESKITGKETNATKVTEVAGGYSVLYYTVPQVQSKYRIYFDAGDGTSSDEYIDYNLNELITASDLATATRGAYTFDGWYIDSGLNTPFAEFTPTTATTVYYHAKWNFVSSFTPVNHNILSNAMQDYFTNISSWVATDATDPSNPAPPAIAPQTKNDYDNGHHLFKSSISQVFTTNGCSPCGENNACSSPQAGTYCDQPGGYDTGLTDDLNVYPYTNGVVDRDHPITYTTSTGGKIYNMIPGVTYYWESVNDNTKYGVITATGNRRTLKTSVRNLRDLGGLSASNSDVTGTIDYGRLYRGAQITSAQGVTDLVKLGITREVDLRGNNDGNQTYKLDYYDTGTKNSYTDIVITNYIINPVATTYITTAYPQNYAAVKSAMRAIMEKVVFNHDSIFFHCTIGTDRTGTMAYFLEGLLGVSEEDRLRDYDLTYFFGLTNRTRFHDTSGWSNTAPRFYSMYRSYPTNADIYNYYTYESHVPDPNDPNDLTDDELLRRFRLELIH